MIRKVKTDWWKCSTFLLLGILIGLGYCKYSCPTIVEKTVTDTLTIRDTVIVHKIPTLKDVKSELIRQNIPHHEIVYAQIRLESNNLKSKITKTHNNILGIRKAGKYKKYNSYKECISDYKQLFSSRYTGGDYYQYLQSIGYAEDQEYIKKLKEFV